MRYLGKAADWPAPARSALAAAVGAVVDEIGAPVEFTVAAVARIGPNGAGALILNGDVVDLRDRLASAAATVAAAEGVELPDDHAGFLPHLTLRWDGEIPPETLIGTPIVASTLRVVFADQATDFDLGQQAATTKETVMATAHTCTCGGAPKLAAYKLVDATGEPASGSEVLLPDGRSGQFDCAMKMLDGSDIWIVLPVEDGKLADWYDRVGVPAGEATLTGKRFQWEDMDDSYDAVLASAARAAGVSVEQIRAAAVGDAPSLVPSVEQQTDSKLDALQGTADEILAKVTDLLDAQLQQAVAGMGELPVI
jgi:hypothetical protein